MLRRGARVSRESSREVFARRRRAAFSSTFSYTVWRDRATDDAGGADVGEPSPVKDADDYPSLKMRYQVMAYCLLADAARHGVRPQLVGRALGERPGSWGARDLAGRHTAPACHPIAEESEGSWRGLVDPSSCASELAAAARTRDHDKENLLPREALASPRCYPYP